MQQNSHRLGRNKSSFLCPRAGCGAIARVAAPGHWPSEEVLLAEISGPSVPSLEGQGALKCRAVPGPAYLHRLLRAAGSVCQASWKRPSDTWSAGPEVRPGGASAHPESRQLASAVRAALHYVPLGPGFFLLPHLSACKTAGQVLPHFSGRPGYFQLFLD